jgi:hypothetical protein
MDSYPRGYANPVNLRASAALPAAGAWDTTPTESSSANVENLTLTFTYTRGAQAGAFDWQLWTSPYAVAANVPTGAEEWAAESIYSAGVLAAGSDVQSEAQREYQTYEATGAVAESFTYGPIALEGTVERVRVRARESGAVADPGTLQIVAEMI